MITAPWAAASVQNSVLSLTEDSFGLRQYSCSSGREEADEGIEDAGEAFFCLKVSYFVVLL